MSALEHSDYSPDKFRGALLGLAVGDALGAPIEGMKPGRIRELFQEVRDYLDNRNAYQKRPYRLRLPGVYTDDTQQALCLAESLVRCYGFDLKNFAKTLLELWKADEDLKSGAFRGIGPTFRKVMTELEQGADPQKTGIPSAGIGSAMRVAPVGLYFAGEAQALIDSAIKQSLLTHTDPRALALSVTVAWLVGKYLEPGWAELKLREQIEELLSEVEKIEELIEREYIAYLPAQAYDFFGFFSRSLKGLSHWQGMEHSLVFKQIVNLANQGFPRQKITSPAQNFSLALGITANFLGMVSRDFESGLIEAVNLGRDADSLGAITGAILGARFGEEAIPERWLKGLRNSEQIRVRAEALWQKSFAGLKIRPLKELELELTWEEIRQRERFIQKMLAQGEYDPEKKQKKKIQEQKQPSALIKKKKGKKEKKRREKAPWKKWQD